MPDESFEEHSYEIAMECSYLLHVPATLGPDTLLVIALHGYGSNPRDMLRLTAPVVGRQHVIASLQAPHQHYLTQPGGDAPSGYNWGIRQHWKAAVQTHQAMIREVLTTLRARFALGRERSLLIGFSQPVGLNYRFAGAHPEWVRGVIAICGGVPRDWEETAYEPGDTAVLHLARDEDPFYPTETALGFPDRLRRHISDVEFHMLPGGHRFPSGAGKIIQPWIARVFPSKPSSPAESAPPPREAPENP